MFFRGSSRDIFETNIQVYEDLTQNNNSINMNMFFQTTNFQRDFLRNMMDHMNLCLQETIKIITQIFMKVL